MTYFNAFARVNEQVTGDDGKVRQAAKCVACGLVWGSASLAIDCAIRNHRNRYVVEYTREHLIDGKLSLVELSYLRQALRREGPKPAALATPATGSSVATPVNTPVQPLELSLAALKALAAEQGYRLSKIPAPKPPKPPVDEEQADNDRLDSLYDEPVF